MIIFRLVRKKYADVLSGKGAAIRGARWNSKGVEMIYCAANRSLAMAEVAVHFSIATLPYDYMMLEIDCPASLKIKEVKVQDLAPDWNVFPHLPHTQYIGDEFIAEDKYALCKVPSVVTQGDFNFLINPKHNSFSKIKISKSTPFRFDRRLF